MIPRNRIPSHPGKVLLNEFLLPANITQVKFAGYLKIPLQRVNEIIRGKRGITPETAWLFSQAFGTTPEFWINLQSHYDLAQCKPITHIKKLNLELA